MVVLKCLELKMLQVIMCPKNGYTVPYLRAVVHHAKIYLRPLQKDLHIELSDEIVEEDEDSTVRH